MNPPKFLHIEMYQGCNLKCEHCMKWKLTDNRKLSASIRRSILEEYALLSPGGSVVPCGGEATIDMEDYFELMKDCRELGLYVISVTNGTTVTPTNASRFVDEGPSELLVSVDSPDPVKHDLWRGINGSHAKALKALRLLLDSRSKLNSITKIRAMTIVGERSYRDLPALYKLLIDDMGVDRLKLNMIQPTFERGRFNAGYDEWFDYNAIKDIKELMSIIEYCDTTWNLNITREWKDTVEMYFNNLTIDKTKSRGWAANGRTTKHICNSYERNIMIDGDCIMRLCFSKVFPGKLWSKPGDLGKFWNENSIRCQMTTCDRYCGISHSVRRVSATEKLINQSQPL